MKQVDEHVLFTILSVLSLSFIHSNIHTIHAFNLTVALCPHNVPKKADDIQQQTKD